MPIYCFGCEDCGRIDEVFRRVADRDDPCPCPCGASMTRDFSRERVTPVTDYPELRRSVAAGIHPRQIPEAMKKHPHHKYDPETGDMLFDSTRHRERCLKDIGLHDRQ